MRALTSHWNFRPRSPNAGMEASGRWPEPRAIQDVYPEIRRGRLFRLVVLPFVVFVKVTHHRCRPICIALLRWMNAIGKKSVERHVGRLRIIKDPLHLACKIANIRIV